VASSPEDHLVNSLGDLLGKLSESSLPNDPTEVGGLDVFETGRVEKGREGRRRTLSQQRKEEGELG